MNDSIKTDSDSVHETDSMDTATVGISQVWLGVIAFMAALIGIWGLICLISGLMDVGIIGIIQDWVAAVNG